MKEQEQRPDLQKKPLTKKPDITASDPRIESASAKLTVTEQIQQINLLLAEIHKLAVSQASTDPAIYIEFLEALDTQRSDLLDIWEYLIEKQAQAKQPTHKRRRLL